jgi:hypothetical protein
MEKELTSELIREYYEDITEDMRYLETLDLRAKLKVRYYAKEVMKREFRLMAKCSDTQASSDDEGHIFECWLHEKRYLEARSVIKAMEKSISGDKKKSEGEVMKKQGLHDLTNIEIAAYLYYMDETPTGSNIKELLFKHGIDKELSKPKDIVEKFSDWQEQSFRYGINASSRVRSGIARHYDNVTSKKIRKIKD